MILAGNARCFAIHTDLVAPFFGVGDYTLCGASKGALGNASICYPLVQSRWYLLGRRAVLPWSPSYSLNTIGPDRVLDVPSYLDA
jgi:hypothetical protein